MIKFNFDKFFADFYSNQPIDHESIKAAIYSLRTGGKRYRFLLSMETAKTYNLQDDENAKRLAVAIELIHNYSLIHDDLPCMDDADERRGLPSCQKKFGEAQAVLAGDGLLNLAAEILFDGQSSKQYLAASKYLFEASGFSGMIQGQSIDVRNQRLNLEEYTRLAALKTSRLITASVISQAINALRSQQEISLLEEYCNLLGIIYQFADDTFDEEEDIFKPSILAYFDASNAKKHIFTLANQAYDVLKKLTENCPDCNYDFLKQRLQSVLDRLD